MSNMIEIRWHGRGGQGAKTASLLLADAAFNTGKYPRISRIWTRKNGCTNHSIQQNK